mgnify:CR=1 FL=1
MCLAYVKLFDRANFVSMVFPHDDHYRRALWLSLRYEGLGFALCL